MLAAFPVRRGLLHADAVPLSRLAERFGTPLYVYSASAIRARYRAFDAAFRGQPHNVCYSVKANSNLSLLRLLARLGAGFDVVSAGELERVLRVSRPAARSVVFSGVGKTADEMDFALRSGILMFNLESESELHLLAERAVRLRARARIAFRVNPDVPAETHPYISTGLRRHKFGVPLADALRLYAQAARQPSLQVAGVSVHIGSQITSPAPFAAALVRVAALVRSLRAASHTIQYVDAGGGLGIPYEHRVGPAAPGAGVQRQLGNLSEGHGFSRAVRPAKKDAALAAEGIELDFQNYARALTRPLRSLGLHLLLEPGRAIVGPAGLLLTRVLYLKRNGPRRFVVVDAAMNDLLRPSLYGAYHEIVPVVSRNSILETRNFDVVGPICETGDFFARDRLLPPVAEGDLLALLDAGAYGMSLASNYNTRPRPAEVLVAGRTGRLIRRRESFDDLLAPEDL